MSTPTPRTDALYFRRGNWANEEELRDLARKLETELASERAKVRTLVSALESIADAWHASHETNPFRAGDVMIGIAEKALGGGAEATAQRGYAGAGGEAAWEEHPRLRHEGAKPLSCLWRLVRPLFMKPTDKQILAECDALRLRRSKPLPSRAMHEELESMIDALTGEIDPTAPEFAELAYHERQAATAALEWKDGIKQKRPSQYWSNSQAQPAAQNP